MKKHISTRRSSTSSTLSRNLIWSTRRSWRHCRTWLIYLMLRTSGDLSSSAIRMVTVTWFLFLCHLFRRHDVGPALRFRYRFLSRLTVMLVHCWASNCVNRNTGIKFCGFSTSLSMPCGPTAWRSYCDCWIQWRHCTLCNVCVLYRLFDMPTCVYCPLSRWLHWVLHLNELQWSMLCLTECCDL